MEHNNTTQVSNQSSYRNEVFENEESFGLEELFMISFIADDDNVKSVIEKDDGKRKINLEEETEELAINGSHDTTCKINVDSDSNSDYSIGINEHQQNTILTFLKELPGNFGADEDIVDDDNNSIFDGEFTSIKRLVIEMEPKYHITPFNFNDDNVASCQVCYSCLLYTSPSPRDS